MDNLPFDDDHAALLACAVQGGALCTVTAIDGSWSRRVGAQLAVMPDGSTCGSLADGCLERALADEAARGGAPRSLRYGRGSPFVDIRLPCGSGVEVFLDPRPDHAALRAAVAGLEARRPVSLSVGDGFVRRYLPRLRLVVPGSGPEVAALARLARAQGIACEVALPLGEDGGALSLGRAPDLALDAWSAVAVLFHDHEWERAILPWALASDAFYVGAQGGRAAREARAEWLDAAALAKLRSPVGLIPHTRTPSTLALSVLAEIVAAYDGLLGQAVNA